MCVCCCIYIFAYLYMLVFLVHCNFRQYHRVVLCLYVFLPSMSSHKRNPDDGDAPADGDNPDDKRRKFSLWSVVQDARLLQSMQQMLEPVIRKVVKEEVELALRKHITNVQRNDEKDGKEIYPSGPRCFQLKFITDMSLPVFTGARIEGRDGSNLTVALIDTLSGEVVDNGPQSSAKVEVVVLEGDFEGGGDNYTEEEFNNNIVREREGKKSLLTGDTFVNLKDGIGSVGEISFTDNSSWTRSRRFRLGARIIGDDNGTRVLEAKTASFVVRDHRGELYKKHHPPSLQDEVWRLQKISKDGAYHKRLSQEKIKTVQDFLKHLYLQPSRLRNILGGMSTKMWEAAIEHAQTCVLNNKIYVYKPRDLEQKSGVVFNVVGQVMGLLSDYQYVPIDKLSETEKADAHNLVISAYEHWEDVDSIDDETSLVGGPSHPVSFLYTPSSPMEDHCYGNKYFASPKFSGFDFTPSNAYASDILSSMGSIGSASGLVEDHALQGFDSMVVRYDQIPSSPIFGSSSLIFDSEPLNSSFCDVDHQQVLESDMQCSSILESQATLIGSSSTCDAQTRWTKVYGVLQWYFLFIRRNKRRFEIYKGGRGKEKLDYG